MTIRYIKRSIRRLVRACLHKLPGNIKSQIIRRLVAISYKTPKGLHFKIAETRAELEGALSILHDEYVRSGYMDPHPSGLRVTLYHALPTTTTLVGKIGDEVIATVSIVRNSPLGFPLSRIFDTSGISKFGARLAEISSLAVRKDYQKQRGTILFPLLKYLYHYCTEYFGVNYLVIAVNPSMYDFYESVLFFKKLKEMPVKHYDFVNGAPAVGGYLNLRDAYKLFAFHYGLKPAKHNLFHYFTEFELPNAAFPNRDFFTINDPVLTPDILDYFFVQKTNIFSELTARQKSQIFNMYSNEDYRKILPCPDNATSSIPSRRNVRHEVACSGRIILNPKRVLNMRVKNVCLNGFLAYLDGSVRFGEPLRMSVAIADFEIADLIGWPIWSSDNGMHGFHVESYSENWENFIAFLEERHQGSKTERKSA